MHQTDFLVREPLLDARQRRAQALLDAGARILDGVPRRVAQFKELAEVHSYFAADALLAKLGKHKTGKSCLYLKKLSDADPVVLREIIKDSVASMAQ